jgi:hypothetical protein
VVLTHILIPLFALADVAKIKEKVLTAFVTFRMKYLDAPRDVEEGGRGPDRLVTRETESTDEAKGNENPIFNAAKFLYTSWRVASLSQELPESRLILYFTTLWPKRKFGVKQAKVSTEYEQAVILTALSRILLYFLGSLLRFHTLVQDIFLQTVCNSGLALLGFWMIHLFNIHPALPVAVLTLFVLAFYALLRLISNRADEILSRLSSIVSGETSNPPSRSSSVLPSNNVLSATHRSDIAESTAPSLPVTLSITAANRAPNLIVAPQMSNFSESDSPSHDPSSISLTNQSEGSEAIAERGDIAGQLSDSHSGSSDVSSDDSEDSGDFHRSFYSISSEEQTL